MSLACGSTLGAHNAWWVFASTLFDAALYPIYFKDSIATELDGGNSTNSTGPIVPGDPGADFGPAIGQYSWSTEGTFAHYRRNNRTDEIVDELEEDLRHILDYVPVILIVLITLINLAGVDWLLRFESLLAFLALMPCLLVLGFGFPMIKQAPLVSTAGTVDWPGMISKSLWLYGGFTNLGVLAGECRSPRRSYLIAVAVLVPLKVLLRFVPFLIAFSVGADSSQDLSSAGFFQLVAGEVAGQWLRTWYFVGSILCYIGFYNAMAMNCERTAFYFVEERFPDWLRRREQGGWLSRWLFVMPDGGGIRRFYIVGVATAECFLAMTLEPGILIELEMLIYALSAALFFYSFVFLRFQRTAKFSTPHRDALGSSEEQKSLLDPDPLSVSLDAEGQTRNYEVYNIGGGNVVAILVVVCPVAAFVANTAVSVSDAGDLYFPYFKLVCLTSLIGVGVLAQLGYRWLHRKGGGLQQTVFGTKTL